MPHRQPRQSPPTAFFADMGRINAEHNEEELGLKATEIGGVGTQAPELLQIGDEDSGVNVLSGLPLENQTLRRAIISLFQEQLFNAIQGSGGGEFPTTLAALGGPAQQQSAVGGSPTSPPVSLPEDLGGFSRPTTQLGASPGAAGAGSGALQGAGIGTAIAPGVGTAIGAGLGGLLGLLGGTGGEQPIAVDSGAQFEPQFSGGNDNGLAIFLQLLQALSEQTGSESLPLGGGASPHTAGFQQADPSFFDTESLGRDSVSGGGFALPPTGTAPAPGFDQSGQPIVPNQPPPPQAPLPQVDLLEGGDVPGGFNQPPVIDPNILPPGGDLGGGGGQGDTGGFSGFDNNAFADILKQFSLPAFDGNTNIGPTPLQQQSTDFASDLLANNPFAQTENINQALSDLLSGQSFDNTAQFDALEVRNKRRLEEEQAQLSELFGTQGARFGSDIARGSADLRARSLEAGALQRAQIEQSSFQDAQNRRLQSLTAPGQIGQQQLNQATSAFNIGQANQATEERNLQRQMAEFARTQGALFPFLLQSGFAGFEGDTGIINQ